MNGGAREANQRCLPATGDEALGAVEDELMLTSQLAIGGVVALSSEPVDRRYGRCLVRDGAFRGPRR